MTEKPFNVWLFVILSLIPFVGFYPLIKLKKTRKMLLINTIAVLLGYGLAALFLEKKIDYQIALLPVYASALFLYIGDGIFIYGWVKEHNKKLLSNSTR